MITPSFGLTATERVLPKLALDFTTASLDPRVTFTRAGNTATVVNSSGYVVPINADLPRFDFNPTTLVCNGLLIEESRTNLMTYSSDFANAFWTTQRASVSSNATTAPDNTLTADKLVEDTTVTNSHQIYSGAFGSAATYTFTVFAKAGERSTLQIQQESGGNSRFLLTGSGTATALGANTVSITPFGNGWYRCTTTFTATGAFRVYMQLSDGTTTFYTGNGTSGLFIWGAQLEAGAFPTSYIPTVASQVTRTADVATMTGTNFSNWYNDNIGTFVTSLASMQVKGTTDSVIFELFNNSAKNNRRGNFINAATGNLVWRSANNAGTIVDVNVASAATANASKTACAWSNSATFIAESVNASAAATSSSASTPTSIDTLNIGRSRNDGAFFNQIISKLSFYPQTLINAELQAFSK
jgi:hypothetical protein